MAETVKTVVRHARRRTITLSDAHWEKLLKMHETVPELPPDNASAAVRWLVDRDVASRARDG